MTRNLCIALLLAFFITAGCVHTPPPLKPVPLTPIDAAGLEKVLQKHRGNLVLMDFWATWCAPCVKLLPHNADLHRRLGNRGLTVVTISLDDPDQRSAAEKTLAQAGCASTENYLSTYGVGPAAFSAFAIESGALPHLRLYDREGNLLKTFGDAGKPVSPTEIDQAVDAALLPAVNSPLPLGEGQGVRAVPICKTQSCF